MKLRLPSPGVFGAVTLLALIGGLLLSTWWPYACEQAVVQKLEASGAAVGAEYEFVGGTLLQRYSDSGWLNWFRRITRLRVSMQSRGVPLENVPGFAMLHRCESVSLSHCMIDRNDMQRIAACSGLTSLELEDCHVESGALHGFDNHPYLADIRMVRSEVPDGTLELPAAPRLYAFRSNFNWSLHRLDVSAAPQLRRLELKNCGIDDECVFGLLDAPRISVLSLANTRVTDSSVNALLQLEALRFLDLRVNHRMTTAEVARLADLPRLRTLAVLHTVPPDDFDALRETVPAATMDPAP